MRLVNGTARSVESNTIDYDSDNAEDRYSHWTTRPNSYAFAKINEGENVDLRSKLASVKAEYGEETETELSREDD